MYSPGRENHVEEVEAKPYRIAQCQSDYLADLPLYPLCASMAPAHTWHTKAMSRLQKSLLANSKAHAYIYVLEDPRNGQVRYVGRTKAPRERYYAHCISGSTGMTAWAQELRAHGLRPSLHVIEAVERQDLLAREYYWIRFFAKRARILNTMYVKRRKPQRSSDRTLPLFPRKK